MGYFTKGRVPGAWLAAGDEKQVQNAPGPRVAASGGGTVAVIITLAKKSQNVNVNHPEFPVPAAHTKYIHSVVIS